MKVNFGFSDVSDLRLKLIERVRPAIAGSRVTYITPPDFLALQRAGPRDRSGEGRHSHDDFGPVTQPILGYLADLPNTRSRHGTTRSPVHHPYGAPASR